LIGQENMGVAAARNRSIAAAFPLEVKTVSNPILILLCGFCRDFLVFAGARGLGAFLFVLLGAATESVGLVLLIPFFSVIFDSHSGGGWVQGVAGSFFALVSVENRTAKLSMLVAAFAVLMVVRAAIVIARDVMISQLEIGFVQQIRCRITRRLAAARWDVVSRLHHSRITHLMSADVKQLESAIHVLLHDAAVVVVLATYTALAFLLAPLLGSLALGIVLLGAPALLPMVRRAHGVGRVVANANLSLTHDVTQFLGALKLAISQNLQGAFIRNFDAKLSELARENVRYVRQHTMHRLAVTTLSSIVGAVAILLGIIVFDVSPSVLITLLFIIARMSGPATKLQLDAQYLAQTLPAYDKIRNLENELAVDEAPVGAFVGSCIAPIGHTIVLRKVSFLYDAVKNDSATVSGVRDIDLIIEPGSIVGIAGPSGAGKTTFADLLVGLYPPQSGEILVGGVPLIGPLITKWRDSVSYVAQDPFLFHDTIRYNLLWANPKADETFLWKALHMAGAEEIVRNSAQGLDTVVGERGSLLSGGERQRLCLARAMLRRPQLLVLDEATSAIDIEGERSFFEQLLRFKPRPTIVLIAHRKESLRYCPRVLFFEGGRIVSDSAQETVIGRLVGVSQSLDRSR
jgi:ATP-binding cassette subfamily C protein